MKSIKFLFLAFLLTGLGAFVLLDDFSPSEDENFESNNKKHAEILDAKNYPDSVAVIDFPLLAEARPTDLIDM